MRRLILLAALCSACSGGSPTAPAPTPVPVPIPTPPPAPALTIESQPCPTQILGFAVDLAFYREIGCNSYQGPLASARRWTRAPALYIRTVDEAGVAIDGATLDTVQSAMTQSAAILTAGRFGLAGVERGTGSREGVTGYVTVKWPSSATAFDTCGRSQVAVDGGWIELNYLRPTCSCGASKIYPRLAAHELGHALGYYHTDTQGDLMYPQTPLSCEPSLSAREQQAVAYHYR